MASAAASHRGNVGPGWIASLLGVLVLVAGGFLAGLLVGIVSQEPELVAGHLAGRSEVVDWSPEPLHPLAESQPLLPAVSAENPAPEADPRAVPMPIAQPQAKTTRFQDLAPVAAPEPRPPQLAGQGYAVQVGAFAEGGAAESLAYALQESGFPAYVTASAADTDQRWRVRVGPLATRAEADAIARRLKRDEQLPTWVLNQTEH